MNDSYRNKLNKLLVQYEHACRQVKSEKELLRSAKRKLTDTLEAQGIVQQLAQEVQQQAHQKITAIVTRCLRTVFGEDAYEFGIQFEQKRGKTEAVLLFVREGLEVDPLDATGGGVVDVASLALRLSCLLLTRPSRRRFLCLDEPLKHLSKEYRPAIRELLLVLAKELQVQIVMVTHSPELAVGKIIEMD